MLQRRNIEMGVGIFVMCGILAFLMLALRVSGLNDIYSPENGYHVVAEFANVGGLKPKAKVSIGGVVIGRVLETRLDNENYVAVVTMLIDKDVATLPDDTRASILTSGLLGDNYIGLTPGFSDTFLKEGSHIAVENTDQAVVLEQLISKFVANKASE